MSVICSDMNPVYNDMKIQNTLATDGAISARMHFEIFFLIFPRKEFSYI